MTKQVNTTMRAGMYGITAPAINLVGFTSPRLRLGELLLRGETKTVDPASSTDSTGNTDVPPGREYPGTPRWVKVFGISVIVLVLLVVIIIFIGGHTSPVQHGP